MRNSVNVLLFIIILTLAGCAPWMEVGGGHISSEHDYSIDLPEKWMKKNQIDFLLITRDGLTLQNVILQRYSIAHEFKNTQKKFKSNMLPQEVSEVILDDISANTQECQDFKVLENSPAMVAGEKGFRVVFTYQNSRAIRYKSMYYGFLSGDYVYGIQYTAANRYYYDKDLQTFETIVKSFKRTVKS